MRAGLFFTHEPGDVIVRYRCEIASNTNTNTANMCYYKRILFGCSCRRGRLLVQLLPPERHPRLPAPPPPRPDGLWDSVLHTHTAQLGLRSVRIVVLRRGGGSLMTK